MIFAGIKSALSTAKNFAIQHSPEILLGTSILCSVGATVTGCMAMTKMDDIIGEHKEALDILHTHEKNYESSSEYKKDLTKEYGRYWFKVAKTWAPCVALTLASGTAALASFKIIKGRLIIAETAFAGVTKAFEQYRDNVIEDQGEEKDLYYANNGALKKKQELIAAGKYKEKEPKKGELVMKQDGMVNVPLRSDVFHYLFCKESVKWSHYSDGPYYNFRLLAQAQTMFDVKLHDDGVVLLDDVYSYLGLDMAMLHAERAEGRTYGWTLDCFAEDGMPNDSHVLFGLCEYNDTQHRLFRAGQINDVTLHFNARLLTKETNELLARG